MMQCCNEMKTRRAFIVILKIKFPAQICVECGEVFDDVKNPIQKLLLKILNPFWEGAVLVDEKTWEKEQYR